MENQKYGIVESAAFQASLPVVSDLVEAVESSVNFVVGDNVEAVCKTLTRDIPKLTWECNEQQMVDGEGNVQIFNRIWKRRRTSTLRFTSATLDNTGTCSCTASNKAGIQDFAGNNKDFIKFNKNVIRRR